MKSIVKDQGGRGCNNVVCFLCSLSTKSAQNLPQSMAAKYLRHYTF